MPSASPLYLLPACRPSVPILLSLLSTAPCIAVLLGSVQPSLRTFLASSQGLWAARPIVFLFIAGTVGSSWAGSGALSRFQKLELGPGCWAHPVFMDTGQEVVGTHLPRSLVLRNTMSPLVDCLPSGHCLLLP